MQSDVINADPYVIQQCGAESVAPVGAYILDRRIREAIPIQNKGIRGRIVLVRMRIATEDMIFLARIKVDLYIVLAVVEGLHLCVRRVV